MASKGVSVGVKITGDAKGFKSAAEGAAKATEKLKKKVDVHSKGMVNAFKSVASAIGITFAVGKLIEFGKELFNLAARTEGIRTAFNKLNNPNLLRELRKATRDTVDNVTLMQKAIQANNFKIPIENLSTYFKFATNRAIETGESVDYLVKSIIDGVGRKSTLTLDNLGISLIEVQDEMKRTGDFTVAVSNIINRSLSETGEVVSTLQTKTEQVATTWKNFKESLGTTIVESNFFQNLMQGVDLLYTYLNNRQVAAVPSVPYKNEYSDMSLESLKTQEAKYNKYMDTVAADLIKWQAIVDKFKEKYPKVTDPKDRIPISSGSKKALKDWIEAADKVEELNQLYEDYRKTLKDIIVAKGELDAKTKSGLTKTTVEYETLDKLNEKLREEEAILGRLNIKNTEGFRIQTEIIEQLKRKIALAGREKANPPSKADISHLLIPTLSDYENLKSNLAGEPNTSVKLPMSDALKTQIGLVNDLQSAFESMFANIDGGIESMSKAFVKAIEMMAAEIASRAVLFLLISAVTGGTSALFEAMGSFSKFALNGFTKMADGGIVSGPTLANVGEYAGAKSNPEVVAPLDKLKGMLGGQTVNVNVTGKIAGRDIYLSGSRYADVISSNT